MAKKKRITGGPSAAGKPQLLRRIEKLQEDLHRVFCWGACIEAALAGADIDLTPELRTCVKYGIVLELDRLHFEVKAIQVQMARAAGKFQG